MSKIYTFGNSKGGVGKSTLAIQTALGLAARGHNVWFVDGDKQATGMDALTVRSSRGDEPPAASSFHDGAALRAQVKRQAGAFDFTIIDVGGQDNGCLRAAMTVSDALIVPIKPRSFEAWALALLDSMVQEVLSMRDGLSAYVVLNEADPVGPDNRETIACVADYPSLRALKATIGRRKIISTASATGRYIEELRSNEPSTISAIAEIGTLVTMIETNQFDIEYT